MGDQSLLFRENNRVWVLHAVQEWVGWNVHLGKSQWLKKIDRRVQAYPLTPKLPVTLRERFLFFLPYSYND